MFYDLITMYRSIMKNHGHRICALLVFISGAATLIPPQNHVPILHRSTFFGVHLATIALGFLILFMSLQLLRRKALAYHAIYVSLFFLIALNVLHDHHPWRILLYVLTLLSLERFRHTFTVKTNDLNTNRALITSLFVFTGAIIYGAVGFYVINKQAFGVDFTMLQSLKYSFLQLITFQNSVITPADRHGHLFLLSLDIVSIICLVIIVSSLFRPVRFALFASKSEKERARRIITAHSSSVEDFFKLFPEDKHYFFNKSGSAVLAYKVAAGTALILDGPSGNAKAFPRLLRDFILFSDNNGWSAAIIHADPQTERLALSAGMRSIFIGNEAMIDVDKFCQSTFKNKHFRYVENKAIREELSVDFWEPPLDNQQIESLRTISDAWLTTPGRREYTFVMGYFDNEYLRHSEVAILKSKGKIIAYINLIPSYLPDQRSIDHMRHIRTMPSIGMHYLLKSVIQNLHEKKVKTFNLGLSPLSGIEELSDPSSIERLLASLKSFGSRYYSFSGLEQFKNKFNPKWQPRYLLYQGGPANLIKVSNSLSRATTLPTQSSTTQKVILAFSIIAGLSYLSFLLAYPLGLQNTGLASRLGAQGAPDSWVFNGLDILVGILVICLSYVGLVRSADRKAKLQFSLFAAGGVGNILAALTPLNSTIGLYHWIWNSTFLHAFFSGVSIVSFAGAAILYVLRSSKRNWILVGLLSAMLLLTITSTIAIGQTYDDTLQKIQLASIALFITLIGASALKQPLPKQKPAAT